MATRNEQTSLRLSAARSAGALAAVVSADAPLNGYNMAHALHVACALSPGGGEGGESFARALATVLEQVVVRGAAQKLGPKHVSKAFWSASKLGRLAPVAALPAFAAAGTALRERLGALAPQLDGQALTNCLYALAADAGAPSPALLRSLLGALHLKAHELNARDVATFVRARSKVLVMADLLSLMFGNRADEKDHSLSTKIPPQ
ncbi:hypothetical protein T492DRAFT_901746 [Pavlovales sp. CCMP2436]|nr:hypothetical protein T492DRAFT_901746 [Pavlovales sp. CCMP2436]